MAQVYADLLKHICRKPETVARAEALLRTAAKKTAAGTEYSLGGDAAGLPAICAYLASQESGNGDVSEKMAQTASCLARKNFNDALALVLEALEDDGIYIHPPSPPLNYSALLTECHIGRPRFVEECLRIVEGALVQTGELPTDLRLPCNATTLAVFCWLTCTLLNLGKKVNPEYLARKYYIQREDFNIVVHVLETSCRDVIPTINAKVDQLRKAVSKSPAPTAPVPTVSAAPDAPPLPRIASVLPMKAVPPADGPSLTKRRASVSAQEETPVAKKPREVISEEKGATSAPPTEERNPSNPEDKRLVIRLPNVTNTAFEGERSVPGSNKSAPITRVSTLDVAPTVPSSGDTRFPDTPADKAQEALGTDNTKAKI